MGQSFPTFNENSGGDDVRTGLLNERTRTDTLRSAFSGTSFPSSPVVGQHCYRTDQSLEYVCTAITPSVVWAEIRTGTVPLNKGGTGATDAAGVRAALSLGSAALLTAGTSSTNLPNVSQNDAKYLAKGSNLTDLPDKAAARTALELGSAALQSAATFATAAQGALANTALQPGDVSSGIEIVRNVYGSSVTWTKPANLLYVDVEVVGGGGSGGGSTGFGSGGGGGGGGYAKKLIAAASLGATETVSVGGVSGTSSFGAHCSATGGGTGGNSGAGGGVSAGGGAGSGAGGDINIAGTTGRTGCNMSPNPGTTNGNSAFGGDGGCSILGGGGNGAKVSVGGTTTASGSSGTTYGAGGGGGACLNSGIRNGGPGIQGLVIVTEYRSV